MRFLPDFLGGAPMADPLLVSVAVYFDLGPVLTESVVRLYLTLLMFLEVDGIMF